MNLKTFEELKENFYEEVGKIDVGQLALGGFGGNTYKDYAELLKIISELEEKSLFSKMSSFCCAPINTTSKIESEEK